MKFSQQNQQSLQFENRIQHLGSFSVAHFTQSLNLGGRGSTASQFTHGEVTPTIAAWKVPVPLGRECQQETARCQVCRQQRCLRRSFSGKLISFAAAQPFREKSLKQPNALSMNSLQMNLRDCLIQINVLCFTHMVLSVCRELDKFQNLCKYCMQI